MAKSSGETPMMQQHRMIKQKHPDAILLFRVGDFYETFGSDAVTAAGILGITLTKRNNGAASESELAGFPHHALDTYLHKLVKAGYRVAVCDQLEDPRQAKGVVKRGVTDLVSPGTAIQDKLLEHRSNNFLAAMHPAGPDKMGLAFLDLSTGEFFLSEGNPEYADKLLQSLRPSELILSKEKQKEIRAWLSETLYIYSMDSWIFDTVYATEQLNKHFHTHSLKGFGVEDMDAAQTAVGAILHYLRETEHPHLQHIVSLQRIDRDDFLWLDRFTIRNLELLEGAFGQPNCLLSVLDKTRSPMGARLMRRWILFPLIDKKLIEERLDMVETFVQQPDRLEHIRQALGQCGDLERLAGKIAMRKVNPRDLQQIAHGLSSVQVLHNSLTDLSVSWVNDRLKELDDCPTLRQWIDGTISEEAPAVIQKGGAIKEGVDQELDELRAIARDGKSYLSGLQQQEVARTGIPSLKIGFNNVFGYYLEVTNTHKEKVPSDWIRKQTLTNAERYVTPELKEYEEKILGAEEKMLALEIKLFEQLVDRIQQFVSSLQKTAQRIGEMDCLCSFAESARTNQYVRPSIHTDTNELIITGGRHPVIEEVLPVGTAYIDNDLTLNRTDQQLIILTGPNMSGKSALLRQTALITLMGHMGCFVPARMARLPLTDKIFTRVGASDNLSSGESTFLVEMNETASILNNLSNHSLIILDEIGRGTATYDGISLAWSIAEFLHDHPGKPLTLFATHYHELNELESKLSRVKNYHLTHQESGNRILFLRKLAPGGSTHSFGIHVARMAGMPATLLNRATEIMKKLENSHLGGITEANRKVLGDLSTSAKEQFQLSIFDVHSQTFAEIRALVEGLDLNRLTPVEALLKLQEIQRKIAGSSPEN
ncbi:MAG: DNA mismatch repair protein MutS [Bacteroidota bacterium]